VVSLSLRRLPYTLRMMEDRSQQLNAATVNTSGKSVVYIMSRDQRLTDNHALLFAQQHALELKLPLLIVFNFVVVTSRSKEQYQFMIEGLSELEQAALELNIPVLFVATNTKGLVSTVSKLDPAAVFFDFSPLVGPTRLRKTIADQLAVACFVIDTHNIIPTWVASDHQEFAAHTFRPKVHKKLAHYLQEPALLQAHPYKYSKLPSATLSDATSKVLQQVQSCGITIHPKPGEKAALKHLQEFISQRLENYALNRNDPAKDGLSGFSPYLHFGQVSSLRIALEVLKAANSEPLLFAEAKMPAAGDQPSARDGMNALFEEMIVRKELSDNFCLYAKNYTDFSSVPAWASTTIHDHKSDKREFVYNHNQWEQAQTHDPAWNAAQNQLLATGKIHGYMRMYWAKKMLEWSASPEDALADCIYLNDKYSIDGGDPNGYVGILWSIAGLHDRPWTERPVFGKVRYMNYGGLKRKFDIESYTAKWNTQTNLL
jgi:deoxyribodipyrimidine photo-lyase